MRLAFFGKKTSANYWKETEKHPDGNEYKNYCKRLIENFPKILFNFWYTHQLIIIPHPIDECLDFRLINNASLRLYLFYIPDILNYCTYFVFKTITSYSGIILIYNFQHNAKLILHRSVVFTFLDLISAALLVSLKVLSPQISKKDFILT